MVGSAKYVACLEVIGGKEISACLNIPLPLCATIKLRPYIGKQVRVYG